MDELNLRYGVHRKIGQAWVDTDQIAPLLDGLDEVKPSIASPVPRPSTLSVRTTAFSHWSSPSARQTIRPWACRSGSRVLSLCSP